MWGLWRSERSEWSQWLLCLLPGRKASRCCAKLLLLLLLLLLLAACCVRRAAFCRKRLLVSCQLVPSSGFVGCAHPIGNTRRGMRRAARARCCVGAGEGVAAAAWRTLRLICTVLPRLCAAAIFAPYCCCGKGGGFVSASCAATQALQRRHSGARCRAKCLRCAAAGAAASDVTVGSSQRLNGSNQLEEECGKHSRVYQWNRVDPGL